MHSHREETAQLLGESSEPMTPRQMCEEAQRRSYKTDSKNFVNVIWVGAGKMDNVERIPGQGYRLKNKA